MLSKEILSELQQLISSNDDSFEKYAKLLESFRVHGPQSDVWEKIEAVELDIGADIGQFITFLQNEWEWFDVPKPVGLKYAFKLPVGILFMLDTLNMEANTYTNVDIAYGSYSGDDNWTDDLYMHGREAGSHLIEGLKLAKRVYDRDEYDQHSPEKWSASDFADYYFFLGYSGIVISEAFKRCDAPFDEFKLFWGFHDGDFFQLGEKLAGLPYLNDFQPGISLS